MTYVKFNSKPFEQGFSSLVDGFISEWPAAFKKDFKQSLWKDLAPVNVKEKDGSYLLELIAPGFEKADFKINIDNDLLTISTEKKNAEQKDNGNQQNEKYIRKEYNNRSFKRSFTLDEKVDATKIEANYVNGILTLNLPKKEAVKAAVKEITIQ
jgi:HSP20 family protein